MIIFGVTIGSLIILFQIVGRITSESESEQGLNIALGIAFFFFPSLAPTFLIVIQITKTLNANPDPNSENSGGLTLFGVREWIAYALISVSSLLYFLLAVFIDINQNKVKTTNAKDAAKKRP